MTGFDKEFKKSISDFCHDKAVQSPRKADTVYARDHNDKRILCDDQDTDMKYERVRNEFHTEHDNDLYKTWCHENADLITTKRLSLGKPMPCKTTFLKYKPKNI